MKTASGVLFAVMMAYTSVQPVSAADKAKAPERIVYTFGSGPTDGGNPNAGLIRVKGTMYGTTVSGGMPHGGTVFALDPRTGQEQVIYAFCSAMDCADGESPYAGLLNVNGTLYGTTVGGGANGGSGGTVFAVNPISFRETVLYSFCSQQNCADGKAPDGGLIDVNGTLYGTTYYGGSDCTEDPGCGTLFALDPNTGAEQVLHAFGGIPDGANPRATLTNVRGMLYGTTPSGGAYNAGAVFSFDPATGQERVVYSFCSQQNCTDGQTPLAGLTSMKETLYGTTYMGGAYGDGMVFALDRKTGAETVLFSFSCGVRRCRDGSQPYGGLIDVKGMLYGTTQYGGNAGCRGLGCGTVFSLDPNTALEQVIHRFCPQRNCADDGYWPGSNLIDVNDRLYGTTFLGGAQDVGVVFELKR